MELGVVRRGWTGEGSAATGFFWGVPSEEGEGSLKGSIGSFCPCPPLVPSELPSTELPVGEV